tara:strand:- start:186 stop:800 length:615 start_codon:yes stop_codon:yes gene_type:complete
MPYNKTPFKMMGKSPLMKALVGGQESLPDHLKDAIKASPAKKYSPAKQDERELTKAELRARAARAKRSEAQTNKDAAVDENKASRLDLKANKNDRARKRKEGRLAKKEETGKTGVGEVISNVKESVKKNVKILPRAKKAGDSPAKKHSPVKQAKSKKQMRYEKIAQKAENAVGDDKMKKNARLVKKGNKMNKKNNLGNDKLARG